MVLELYVFGPAFGLPSINPQCLATIAFFVQAVPEHEWVLVASCDSTASPTNELPLLHDGARWIGGFQNILDHLRKRPDPLSLDRDSHGAQEKADITAFSSLVECRGQPLLDLSLYVSTENYHSITRPAYSPLLPWDYQWFVPSQHRTAAKSRTEHLNVSSLDLDSSGIEQGTRPVGSNLIPESLRSSHRTISSLLNQPQHASRFRLEALAEEFFDPLHDLLGEKRYMISDEGLSSLDCLAFAYLALALIPNVPQSWLADSMKTRYPALCRYVNNLIQELFDGPVNIEDAFSDLRLKDSVGPERNGTKARYSLPWWPPWHNRLRKPPIATFLDYTLGSIPIIRHLYNPMMFKKDDPKLRKRAGSWFIEQGSFPTKLVAYTGLAAIMFATSSVVIGDLFSDPPASKRTLSDMGEAGAILSMANLNGREPGDMEGGRNYPVPGTEGTMVLEETGGL